MTEVRSPFNGTTATLDSVPDPVFASRAVGDGLAVIPEDKSPQPLTVCAPVSGDVIRAMSHAVVLLDDEGHSIMVHVGIDTAHLRGTGFDLKVSQGDHVTAGDAMLTVDVAVVKANGLNPITSVLVMGGHTPNLHCSPCTQVSQGQCLFTC
ncbi:PTS glucose transporter subunit IIA [Corynebacterium mendelii]|uniref:PTS glucose transporter subunit IIA n=1 Tax=Corynebacterium mendelii TaxID=2765362 RepID=A0A939DYS7_9CORY|nr:PTS glucose transporter subunit IIA [Corynebacterium mendelii]MBN9643331.1 PTS glucose transporter subunit IIA [Corynebacterium mendelii]